MVGCSGEWGQHVQQPGGKKGHDGYWKPYLDRSCFPDCPLRAKVSVLKFSVLKFSTKYQAYINGQEMLDDFTFS